MTEEIERFTECSRVVLTISQQTAEQIGHRAIGLEHILVGMIQSTGIAGDLLKGLGLNSFDVIAWFRDSYVDAPIDPTLKIELAAPVKRFLEASVGEATRAKHIQIHTGHMLRSFLQQDHEIIKRTLIYLDLSNAQLSTLTTNAILANTNPDDKALSAPTAHPPQQEKVWDVFADILLQLLKIPPPKSHVPLTTKELIDRLTTVIAQAPANPHLYAYRASLQLKAKNNTAAVQDFAEALRLKPNFWMVYFLRGTGRFNDKQYDTAIADFTEVIRLAPEATDGYINRAQVYTAQEFYDQALADYDQVLRLHPKDTYVRMTHAGILLDNREFERAFADYDFVLSQLPTYITAQDNRGVVRIYLKDYEGAEADFQEVMKQSPDNSRSHNNMGWLALVRQEYAKAIEYCNEAIRLDPQNGPAYYTRGTARASLGDTEDAATDYRHSLANWKNMTTKLTAPYAEEMQLFLDRLNKTDTSA